ncbi:MAG: hydrogenase maturation nickel metallochaperone HypA [Bryobacterales bacterium]|nr:hydrogenase maturation nickel metallochaperone HypA [Bryobacterales bacterium]
MHEAGIAAGVLELAERVAADRGPGICVRTVRVRVGEFTGVAVEALEFAFESLRTHTRCEDAVLEVERVPLLGLCPNCGWTGPPAEPYCLICPHCGQPAQILSGRELEVDYVDIEGSEEHHGASAG